MPRVVSVLVLVSTLTGCRREAAPAATASPISGQHYLHLFGQRYRTKVDLYLFAFTDDDERVYLGRHDGRRQGPPADLPRAVVQSEVGRTHGRLHILDAVRAGSELTIVAETHEVTAASGIREKEGYPMGFICRLEYGGRAREGVYAEFIQAGEHAPFRTPNQHLDEAVVARVGE
jgi:hypothetical protein